MSERKLKKFILDKILLVLVAIIVFIVGLGLYFYLEDYLHLSELWTMFIMMSCVGYPLISLYLAKNFIRRNKRKLRNYLILFSIIVVMIVIQFLLIYFKVVSIPKAMIVFGVFTSLLAALTDMIFKMIIFRLKK